LRAFNTSSGILGLIFVLLALFCWLYGLRAKPSVVRAANLMCQERDVWGCQQDVTAAPTQAAVAAPTARRLKDAHDAIWWMLQHAEERSREDLEVDAAGGSLREAAPRRLSPARAAVTFEAGLSKEKDANGVSGVCRLVAQLCKAPADFDERTACVCNGKWDYAAGVSSSNASVPARRLAESGAADSGLKDPWQGSAGAYCDAWASGITGEWCFVSEQQICEPFSKAMYTTSSGEQLTRSSGPCGNAVDSRSQFVLDGHRALLSTLEVGAVLGLLLIASSACGVLLYQSPSKSTTLNFSNAHGSHGVSDMHSLKVMDEYSLDQRFEDAQREAVRKLSDQTPEDMKFMLYGFYKQAKEGDVRGDPPRSWDRKEKTKYDYWARHRGMSREQAIEGYIKAVALLD